MGHGWHNYLIDQAERTPDAPALIGPTETLSFKQLTWRVRKYAAALASAGVKRGDLAVVRMPSEYDLVATLALSLLGAVSASNTAKQYYEFEPITDWLLTRKPVENYPEAKQILITPIWIQRAYNMVDLTAEQGFESADDLMRLVFTSGTTGLPKAVPFSCRLIDGRFTESQQNHPNEGAALTLFGMGTTGGSSRAMGELRLGNPYLHLGDRSVPSIVQLSQRVPIARIHGSPGQLAGFFDDFERTPFDFSHLHQIHSGGASLPISFQRRILSRYPVLLKVRYGSTEGGNIAWRAANPDQPQEYVGKLNPGVQLEIVDESGGPLPDGEPGVIRYRTKNMATSYYKNPDATAKSFADGWFYPGDLGWLIDGELYIGGRETEILNLGGAKFDPAILDEVAFELGIYKEAAAFGFRYQRDRQKLGFALVLLDESNRKQGEKEISKVLRTKFKISDVSFDYQVTLPRGETGKVLRAQLTNRAESKNRS